MIDQWLNSRFGQTRSASGGSEIRICCPFCKARVGRPDTGFHMYVNLERPVAHCFRCEWKGHHLSLVISVDGGSYAQALKSIEDAAPDVGLFEKLGSSRGLVQGHEMASMPDGYKPLVVMSLKTSPIEDHQEHPEATAAWRYLTKRNVPLDIITRCFGYVPGTMRVWILIDDNWWQGRLMVAGDPKYISPPWPKGDSLWNAQALGKYDDIVICEGVFSAIAVGDNAIALCGKTINAPQADRIVQAMGKHTSITIMMDADAIQNAHDAAEVLMRHGYEGGLEIRYMRSGDPADGVMGEKVAYDWSTPIKHALGAI